MRTSRIPSLLAATVVCGLPFGTVVTPAGAAPATVPQDLASTYYDAVSSHLEVGGVFYAYVDVDGDLARLAELSGGLLERARGGGGLNLPEKLDAAKIVDGLGLTSVRALGLSSRKLEGNLYHNRAFAHTPGGQKGILRLFGDKAEAFSAPALVPAGADLVVEQELALSTLTETIESVLKSSGNEALTMQFRAALGFPVPGLPMTVGDFLAKLDTRVVAGVRLDGERKINLPGTETSIPAFQAVISLDNLSFLFDPLAAMAAEKDSLEVEKGDGFTIIRNTTSLPGDLDYFQPVVYHDVKSGRILIGTRVEYVKEWLAGAKPLSGDAEFTKAVKGLPSEGNSLSYATPKILEAIREGTAAMAQAAEKEKGKEGRKQAAVDELLRILQELSPQPTSGVAGVMVCQTDGLLFQSNVAESHKQTLAQLAVVPAAMAAAWGEAPDAAGETARRGGKSEPEAEMDTDPADAEPSGNAITNNLRQIAFSAQSYFIDNPSASEVSYGKLLSEDLLYDLEPLSGESYKGLKLLRKGGTLSVKTEDGETVTLPYPPVTD